MNQKTWDKFASIYNLFMRKNRKVYGQMCELMKDSVRGKDVLELATGTGLIARQLAGKARLVEATDFSSQMIRVAKRRRHPFNLHFSVQDACSLPYSDESFDVIVISNALHIMPEPERALKESYRVLKQEGILIAPTFVHGYMSKRKKILAKVMGIFGFHAEKKWTAKGYLAFLKKNHWKIRYYKQLRGTFPLIYVECEKGK
jgi:ubiquinone/menaquinone biosynthesis C-methylase UbiE